ncbi:GNAT family N-acetyltransferase [Actinoplanes sp. NPDC051861]|uniref:GNAT family N-acetyltransferase n=1 Tax=Actinoplanes sp. NPDC051861 TaxID=3155170 RepID=UPI0034229917
MPELIAPTTRLHTAWLAARDEWGRGVHQDGAGFRDGDDRDSAEGFAAWVRRLRGEEDPAVPPVEGWVHCTYRWITEGDRVLGTIALRHELNEMLLHEGGHIGYGIRPSERRRGLASWAVREILGTARELGIDRVLITCKDSNVASARTAESCGGVLEDVRETRMGLTRRYWIKL